MNLKSATGLTARLAILIGDQVLYNGTNFALLVLVARPSSATEFGAFSLLYAYFIFAASLNQSSIGETAIVTTDAASRSAGAPILASWALGALLALPALAASAFLPDQQEMLVVLAAALPFLLAQDAYRSHSFGQRKPITALINDSIWAAIQTIATVAAIALDQATPLTFFASWATAGAVAGVCAMFLHCRSWSVIKGTRQWISTNRKLLTPFFVEATAMSALTNLLAFAVAGIAGLAAAGALRAAQTLFAGQQVLQSALRSFGMAELRDHNERGKRLGSHVALVATGGLIVTAGWTVALLFLPDRWGEALFGDTFAVAGGLIALIAAQRALLAIGIAAFAAIRVLGGGWSIVRDRLLVSALRLLCVCVGAATAGINGAVVALVVTEGFSSALLLFRFRQTTNSTMRS